MSDSFGISGGGRKAEQLFRSLTGADPAPRAAAGDAVLDGNLVEVKQATKATLNQVRAIKYLPLAVYFVPRDEWYIVPAHVVVAAVSQRVRGQHNENPFECSTLNINRLRAYGVENKLDLRSATLEAIEQSNRFPELRVMMNEILQESRGLADDSLGRVRDLLHCLGLGT